MKTVTAAISGTSGEPFGGCWSFPSPTVKVHLFFNSDEYKDVKEVPKALLPVANQRVLSYILELLEQNGLRDAIVVVGGERAALLISSWITSAFSDRLNVEVTAVPEDVGTVAALRAIGHHLSAKDILVVSGDLVSEISPGALAAAHRQHDAVVTAMLCSVPAS